MVLLLCVIAYLVRFPASMHFLNEGEPRVEVEVVQLVVHLEMEAEVLEDTETLMLQNHLVETQAPKLKFLLLLEVMSQSQSELVVVVVSEETIVSSAR